MDVIDVHWVAMASTIPMYAGTDSWNLALQRKHIEINDNLRSPLTRAQSSKEAEVIFVRFLFILAKICLCQSLQIIHNILHCTFKT